MEKVNVGVIGCGNISEKYLENLCGIFSQTQVIAVTDIKEEAAKLRAEQFHIPRVCKSSEELLAIPEIDIVVVLTQPGQHAQICEQALLAGKHTYVEKPLALNTEDGRRLVELAARQNKMLTSAPDTVLGSGIQTARKLIDEGWIGRPFGAISHILTGGPESWHPNPAFLYHKGAGPLYDVAPYYVAGLTYLLGPVESVMCSAKKVHAERTITSEPLYGTKIQVEVPTYLAGILTMENGVVATIHHSYDVDATRMDDSVEIYGTEGTLVIPTPCGFSGKIHYRRKGNPDWADIPCIFEYKKDMRGIGVADMASAILENRSQRLSAAFGYHTLNVLEALDISAQEGTAQPIASTFERTEAMLLNPGWGDEQRNRG